MSNLLYKEEVYDIIGSCMAVYNTLGYGFLEIVYKDAMEIEFAERSINSLREKSFQFYIKEKN